jgi:hypothetical protein
MFPDRKAGGSPRGDVDGPATSALYVSSYSLARATDWSAKAFIIAAVSDAASDRTERWLAA